MLFLKKLTANLLAPHPIDMWSAVTKRWSLLISRGEDDSTFSRLVTTVRWLEDMGLCLLLCVFPSPLESRKSTDDSFKLQMRCA